MMKKNYIIDGFNLGFKIPGIAQWITSGHIDQAIKLIINHIQSSISAKADNILLVLDGRYQNSSSITVSKKIKIRFSRKPQTADDIIRDFIRTQEKPGNWVVVSSDHEIINTARAMGAEVLPSEKLIEAGSVKAKKSQPRERQEKYNPEHIDMDYWLKKFGK